MFSAHSLDLIECPVAPTMSSPFLQQTTLQRLYHCMHGTTVNRLASHSTFLEALHARRQRDLWRFLPTAKTVIVLIVAIAFGLMLQSQASLSTDHVHLKTTDMAQWNDPNNTTSNITLIVIYDKYEVTFDLVAEPELYLPRLLLSLSCH